MKSVKLLNDCVALGYGSLNVASKETRCIYDPQITDEERIA